ncbi:MAG: hypothetical protein K6E27_03595 [Eubacterium sp.]|nr:hypothetical protein [Eubacterium sp.]
MNLDACYDWEKKHDLINGKEINGFQYWNYMRRDMFMSFEDEYTKVDPVFYKEMTSHSDKVNVSKLKKALRILSPEPHVREKQSDVLFLCHSRRYNIDNKMVSIYTDFVADFFPGSISLQRFGLGQYKNSDVYTKNLTYADKLCTMSYIYRYFNKYFRPGLYKNIRRRIYEDMKGPFQDLRDNYGFHANANDFADRATILYFLYKFRKKGFKKFLKKTSPKILVEVVGGSFDSEIFNELSQELGIETIELQHGTGTIKIGFPQDKKIKQFPKWFFTFGDFWTENCRLPIPADHVCSMGFPYHDIQMSEYPVESWKHDFNSIIFLSSPKYGKEMSELAVSLKKDLPELRIIFKLHPKECNNWRENYTLLASSDIEVIDNVKTPLYQLFTECSMQVGVESTAIYEGLSCALDTYIWDIPRAFTMKALLDSGHAKRFKTADDLKAIIHSRDADADMINTDTFWKHNALENIVSGIKEIKSGNKPKQTI